MCCQQGFLPLPLTDGSIHYQPFLIQPDATDTILSPAHVMWSSSKITSWEQSGSKDPNCPGTLQFHDSDGYALLTLPLTTVNGLLYCSTTMTSTSTVHTVSLAGSHHTMLHALARWVLPRHRPPSARPLYLGPPTSPYITPDSGLALPTNPLFHVWHRPPRL
jgi:hypothetical protein